VQGVIRTRVGYTGGSKDNPSYHNMGDHTESIQIDFDPALISYRKLLRLFWQSHSVTSPAWSRQYMSAIWYHNKDQKRAIEKSKAKHQRRLLAKGNQAKIATVVARAGKFTLAEDYHQKFYLRKHDVLLSAIDAKDDMELINSHVATRLNGYVAGQGTSELLQGEIDAFGLDQEAKDYLTNVVSHKKRGFFCTG